MAVISEVVAGGESILCNIVKIKAVSVLWTELRRAGFWRKSEKNRIFWIFFNFFIFFCFYNCTFTFIFINYPVYIK